MVPDGMPDTSKPLPLEYFFISPRCPLDAVSSEAAAVHEAGISDADEHLSTAVVELDNEPDSCAKVIGENEKPGVLGRS